MKKSILFILISFTLSLFSCSEKSSKQETASISSQDKIEIIDFHSTHRCFTCNAIESNTKFTLDTYFEKELINKTITFQVLNVDEEKNASMAEKFEATGTSLFINVISDGKEETIDLTSFAFAKGKNQETFSQELKIKIENALKTL